MEKTKTLPKQIESQVYVRFPDCDPFGHLNNSRYIDYIINAREDQLVKFYDFDVYKFTKQTGNGWVVAQNQIAYLASADLMELITITTRLISFSERSLLVEAEVWDENKTQLKSVMWTRLVHFNLRSKKSEKHSDELNSLFSSIVFPPEEEKPFEERVKELNNKLVN